MKLTKQLHVERFIEAVGRCKGAVWLTSQDGDQYNLKSYLSQYVAIGALLSEHGDELELWCGNKEDEANFRQFFTECPDVLAPMTIAPAV